MPVQRSGLSRAQFLRAAGAAAAGLWGLGALAPTTARARAPRFRSRPDLRPPGVTVTPAAGQPQPTDGYWFLGPTGSPGSQAGPLIVDASGNPVWFQPLARGQWASNFRTQTFLGRPVLTWWQGSVAEGYGQGEGVIVDSSYNEIARVQAGNGRQMDLHEFLLTHRGTALITCYPRIVQRDLSAVGGARNGQVYESIIQEVDVASGRVVFEWRSLEHVDLSESYVWPSRVFDYVHANSIDVMFDGNLLVSARHTFALYKLDRRSGRIIWRLGGKHSDFAIGRGAGFSWQHDARQLSANLVSLFDDGAGLDSTESRSRAIVLQLYNRHRLARLVSSYHYQRPLLATAMGSMQMLQDGNVAISWGNTTVLSEVDAHGRLLTNVQLAGSCQSYRGYRLAWSGTPAGPPTLAARTDPTSGGSILYASWNGATEVASWQVSGGLIPTSVPITPRSGFETAIPVGAASGSVVVTALDASGNPLGSSNPVTLPG